jgi:putative transposase
MPRAERQIIPSAPHHVTQRGNRRGPTFFNSADYVAYLALATEEFARAKVDVWAYCLMPNHVHIIAAPTDESGLSSAMGRTHRRYTDRINRREGWSGHLWQGRFACFSMDETYLERCVRYVCMNPVRAGLVDRAPDWPWSSVNGHLHCAPDALLNPEPIWARFGGEIRGLFEEDVVEADLALLRRSSATGRPLARLKRALA